MDNTSTHFVVEECWLLVGMRRGRSFRARRVRATMGTPVAVSFDAKWALHREELNGDIIGFYHTHPSGMPDPSGRDHRTMNAWVAALGKPLLCIIEADNTPHAYQYAPDEQSPSRIFDFVISG